MRRHRRHWRHLSQRLDPQEVADSVHDAVNTAVDAAMRVLFEAADHVEDVIREFSDGARARRTEPAGHRDWNDTE